MLDITTILDKETFTPEEQLEIIQYIDAQLEQMELLLYRLDRLAKQASGNDVLDTERRQLQTKARQIEETIDLISKRLPQTFISQNKV
ncbi:MAG: hypothetical protein HFH02_11600 [Dorea sp.]|nr:hypothetical protein [Dorea sp.]